MSYILEALRRSQAERERGNVPGLDAQSAAVGLEPAGSPRAVPLAWMAAAAVLVLLLGVGIAAWMRQAAAPPSSLEAAPPRPDVAPHPSPPPGTALPHPGAAAPSPSATTAAPGLPPAAVPAPPAVAAAPAPRLPMVVSAPAAPAATPPPAGPTAVTATAGPPAPPRPARPDATAPHVGPATATPSANPAAAPPQARQPPVRIPAMAELSAEQRRDLPALVVGGSVWSDSPASRFVIINGQVSREGDAVAPGVVVERIGPKAAVLRRGDLRFELAY